MASQDELILEFQVESILEIATSDDGEERVSILIQLREGGPIRLLLSQEKALAMLGVVASALGAVSERDRLNRAAAKTRPPRK